MQNTNQTFGETPVCLLIIALCTFIAIAFAPILIDFFSHIFESTTYEMAEWVSEPHPLY